MEDKKEGPEQDWSQYRGVMIVVEQRDGAAKPVSWQLLGQGRKLADKISAPLMALVIGSGVGALAEEAVACGADKVYLCDAPVLKDYRTRPYSRVCLQVIHEFKPEIVLFGATATGRDLAGAIATRLPTGLTADTTELDVEADTRLLLASRPAFSEKMMATILCKQYKPQMATARAGVFQALPKDEARRGEIVEVAFTMQESEIAAKLLEFIPNTEESANIEEADIIVAGGRGLGGPEGFGMLQELAELLGGVVGGTRPCVEAGWIAHDRQIGQTGHTVRPKLYVAVGISGAVQHTVGMSNADYIVAINQDANAPIFQFAHYGIVGDLFQLVPELIRRLKSGGGLPGGALHQSAGAASEPAVSISSRAEMS